MLWGGGSQEPSSHCRARGLRFKRLRDQGLPPPGTLGTDAPRMWGWRGLQFAPPNPGGAVPGTVAG